MYSSVCCLFVVLFIVQITSWIKVGGEMNRLSLCERKVSSRHCYIHVEDDIEALLRFLELVCLMSEWPKKMWYYCWNEVIFIRQWKNDNKKEVIPRSWIGGWKYAIAIIHYTLCNTHYSLITMPWDTRLSLVGWSPLISIAIDGMESDNTKNSHRINMESFPLPD